MPVKGLAEFNKKLEDFAKKLVPEQVTTLQKKVVLEIANSAILLTPVDTGRARGGWQVSVGGPAQEAPKGLDKDGQPTINAAVQAVEGLPPFQVVIIQNNVEYIGFIEEGTDKVPPVAMLARSIDRIASVFPGGGAS